MYETTREAARISRRNLLKAGGALAVSALPGPWTPGAAAQAAPLRLGFQVHRTGIGAVYGRWYERTTTAAVKFINEKGGIGGRLVEIVAEDDGTDPKRGAEVVEKLAVHHKVDLIFGTLFSHVVIASAPRAGELKNPLPLRLRPALLPHRDPPAGAAPGAPAPRRRLRDVGRRRGPEVPTSCRRERRARVLSRPQGARGRSPGRGGWRAHGRRNEVRPNRQRRLLPRAGGLRGAGRERTPPAASAPRADLRWSRPTGAERRDRAAVVFDPPLRLARRRQSRRVTVPPR